MKRDFMWHCFTRFLRHLPLLALATGGMGCATAATDSSAGAGLSWKAHFAGLPALTANANTAKLREIWSMPESLKFRDALTAKLAGEQGTKATGIVATLLADLPGGEALIEYHGQQGELVVALAADEARHSLWSSNLSALVTSLNAPAPKAHKDGWSTDRTDLGELVSFDRADGWIVLGIGKKSLPRHKALLAAIKKNGRIPALAADRWLEGEVDLAWLNQSKGLGLPGQLPRARFSLSSTGEITRTTGTLDYPKPVDWRPEPWTIPTNTIREPISFTAANGIGPWLAQFKAVQDLKLKTVPTQWFAWGLPDIPVGFYAAFHTDNATNTAQHLAQALPPVLTSNLLSEPVGELFWRSNRAELVWQGLPLMLPLLAPLREANGDYVFGGMVPQSQKAGMIPEPLTAQIQGRNDLAYYDWEITQFRLAQWSQFLQLVPLFTKIGQARGDKTGQQWVAAIAPKLGNTATQITRVSPTQFAFRRSSHLGLNSIELILLARWIDGTEQLGMQIKPRKPAGSPPAPPKP